ncbi:hypothetical protein FQA47_001573 [Oryzias melastigma]|uniref:Uncharacterized protein n=1 Tax=Oryzias melastigma TaxID=30732 RepID=A0A834FVA8_ORYME|nr:hypothetical protein FQA47_001573 [Oryzias melastigma]
MVRIPPDLLFISLVLSVPLLPPKSQQAGPENPRKTALHSLTGSQSSRNRFFCLHTNIMLLLMMRTMNVGFCLHTTTENTESKAENKKFFKSENCAFSQNLFQIN